MQNNKTPFGNNYLRIIIVRGDFLQYSKVEICGVNASKLKVLSESRKRELMETIANGSKTEKKLENFKFAGDIVN